MVSLSRSRSVMLLTQLAPAQLFWQILAVVIDVRLYPAMYPAENSLARSV
jgi:hypothetical protein